MTSPRDSELEALRRQNEALQHENAELRANLTRHQSAKLDRPELLLCAITEALPLGLLVLDNRSDDFLFFNKRLTEIWEIEHLLPRMRAGRIKNQDVLRECLERVENVESFFAGSRRLHDPDNREVLDDEVVLKNGRILRRFSCQLRDQIDGYLGRLYLFEDITERRRVEAQFRHAQRMESVGRLAGGIAHDINNLLTVILNHCQLLLASDAFRGGHRQQLEEVHEAAWRSSVVTRELLTFSRKQVHSPRVVSLNHVIEGIHNILGRLLDERMQVELQLQPDLWSVKADPGQLEQAIINLAVNARDAMPDGGSLKITTRNTTLSEPTSYRIDTLPPGEYVVLSIQDAGTGIAPEHLDRIFEPFFTTKATGSGTGLGLSTVYGIVTQSGGTMDVRSELGRGTAFDIYLPRDSGLASEASPSSGNGQPTLQTPQPAPGPSRTVLLVDDNNNVRVSTKLTLETMGYRVVATGDPEEALRLFESLGQPIDVVLIDVIMPRRTGPELVDDLRTAGLSCPVIFMSGFAEESTASLFEQGDDLIRKPFTPQDLSERLQRVLENPQ